ncbi:hypothetical protein [Pararhizobium sp. A13]|uniref:hypothetical protein n=1 Tax=Pararhizobium sp. A13 TaxID=3133975 RepID=UPI00311ADB98
MEIDLMRPLVCLSAILAMAALSGCGTVKEKTAPCKRPAELSSYAQDPRQTCGAMRAINDPAAAFAAIGMEQ